MIKILLRSSQLKLFKPGLGDVKIVYTEERKAHINM